jgi:hypothetical protein
MAPLGLPNNSQIGSSFVVKSWDVKGQRLVEEMDQEGCGA